MNNYKVILNDEVIYSPIDIINHDNDVKYYIVKGDDKIEIDKSIICKPTELKCATNETLYENDIINIECDDGDIILMIKYYKGVIEINGANLYMDGLVLMDFDFKPYFISGDILKNPQLITCVGNILLNNIKDISKEN